MKSSKKSCKSPYWIAYFTAAVYLMLFLHGCSTEDLNAEETKVLARVEGASPTRATNTYKTVIPGSEFGWDVGGLKVFINGKQAMVDTVDREGITLEVSNYTKGPYTLEVWKDERLVLRSIYDCLCPKVTVSTMAGSTQGWQDGVGSTVKFDNPRGVAIELQGDVFVGGGTNNRVRKISPNGTVTTYAGSVEGYADGQASDALFGFVRGVEVDSQGNVYVADSFNEKIRKIAPNGQVTTLAGSSKGFSDGTGSSAMFNGIADLAMGQDGNLYVADQYNNRIRKVTPNGTVTTVAGGAEGYADGFVSSARLDSPAGVTVDDNGIIWVADTGNHVIRKIYKKPTILPGGVMSEMDFVTTYAGSSQGFVNGQGSNAKFYSPMGITVDEIGNLYVADLGNHRIRIIKPGGYVCTYAGSGYGYQEGSGSSAKFWGPTAVDVGTDGTVYVADRYNHRIRKITLD